MESLMLYNEIHELTAIMNITQQQCNHIIDYYLYRYRNQCEREMENFDDPDLDFGYVNEPAYYGDTYVSH